MAVLVEQKEHYTSALFCLKLLPCNYLSPCLDVGYVQRGGQIFIRDTLHMFLGLKKTQQTFPLKIINTELDHNTRCWGCSAMNLNLFYQVVRVN